jgi:hypothetical protein
MFPRTQGTEINIGFTVYKPILTYTNSCLSQTDTVLGAPLPLLVPGVMSDAQILIQMTHQPQHF